MEILQHEVVAQLLSPVRQEMLHLQHADRVPETVSRRPPQVDFGIHSRYVLVQPGRAFHPPGHDLADRHFIQLQPDVGRYPRRAENTEYVDEFPDTGQVVHHAGIHDAFLEVDPPALRSRAACKLSADRVSIVSLHNAVEPVAGNHGVQVIRSRVPVLNLLPVVRPIGTHDPWHVRIQLAYILGDRDDLVLDQETPDPAIRFGNPLGVLFRRCRQFDLGQIAVTVLFQRVDAPQAVEFAQAQRHDLVGIVRHQLDVLEVPVEIFPADAALAGHGFAILRQPGMKACH